MRTSLFLPVLVSSPLSVPALGAGEAALTQQAVDATKQFAVLEGFQVERLYEVPKKWGSWVALAVRPDGRLIAADQYGGGLYLVTVGEKSTRAEKMSLEIGGVQGLLWHRGALYLSLNEKISHEKGIYRARDADGDGTFEAVELIKAGTDINYEGASGSHEFDANGDVPGVFALMEVKGGKFERTGPAM